MTAEVTLAPSEPSRVAVGCEGAHADWLAATAVEGGGDGAVRAGQGAVEAGERRRSRAMTQAVGHCRSWWEAEAAGPNVCEWERSDRHLKNKMNSAIVGPHLELLLGRGGSMMGFCQPCHDPNAPFTVKAHQAGDAPPAVHVQRSEA